MDLMREYPDKHFELAIVDPPYGIGFSDYERGGSGVETKERYTNKGKKTWDKQIPNQEYFEQLFRVSKNQIIWGANYFPSLWVNGCKGFIFWHKHQPVNNFAKGELAYSSFDRPANCFDFMYYGNVNRDITQLHPTQKPVSLYKWLLQNYAKQGDKILDTHLGSGSIAIACHQMGFDLTGSELDKDYFEAMQKRIKEETAQLDLLTA